MLVSFLEYEPTDPSTTDTTNKFGKQHMLSGILKKHPLGRRIVSGDKGGLEVELEGEVEAGEAGAASGAGSGGRAKTLVTLIFSFIPFLTHLIYLSHPTLHLTDDIDRGGHTFADFPNGLAAINGPDAISNAGLLQSPCCREARFE